ncbi:acyl-CoA dehydrogenase [candidate division KSB1 bacterium]
MELTEEQKMLKDMTRDFCRQEIAPIAEKIDKSMEFPMDTIKQMGELGLMGVPFPEEFGGAGMNTVSYTIVVEELAKVCASHSITCAAHTSLGANPIHLFGTDDQKKKYLAPLASGEVLGAFCLTEPSAGSDIRSMKTTAQKVDGGFEINGSKAFITNAGYADTFIVFAITEQSETDKKISAFIVEKDTPGLKTGLKENKMGWRASDTRQVFFDKVFVPDENLLGKLNEGFKQAVIILDGGRISVAALSLGIADAAFEESLKYSQERHQFGKPLSAFQTTQIKIADMATQIEAARLLTYKAAGLKDEGKDYLKEASMAKLFASEVATRTASEAVQIHGGYGYSMEYPVERYFRDAKACEIGEGTSEIQRLLLARQLFKES